MPSTFGRSLLTLTLRMKNRSDPRSWQARDRQVSRCPPKGVACQLGHKRADATLTNLSAV
jgi:hypothetical protein